MQGATPPAPCEAQQRCAIALRTRPEKLEGKHLLYAAIAAAQSCGCCAARATASANFAAAVPPCAHPHAAPQPSLAFLQPAAWGIKLPDDPAAAAVGDTNPLLPRSAGPCLSPARAHDAVPPAPAQQAGTAARQPMASVGDAASACTSCLLRKLIPGKHPLPWPPPLALSC